MGWRRTNEEIIDSLVAEATSEFKRILLAANLRGENDSFGKLEKTIDEIALRRLAEFKKGNTST